LSQFRPSRPGFRSLPLSAPSVRQAPSPITGVVSALLHAPPGCGPRGPPADGRPTAGSGTRFRRSSSAHRAGTAPRRPSAVAAPTVARAPEPVSAGGFVAPVEVPTRSSPRRASTWDSAGASRAGSKAACRVEWWRHRGRLPDARRPRRWRPVRVGLEVKEPRRSRRCSASPVYPSIAGAEWPRGGLVVLECVIDPGGGVVDVKVVEGCRSSTEAAIEAVRQWWSTRRR